MGNPLWAPWRMEYILGPKDRGDCIFCGIPDAEEEEQRSRLVVAKTPRAFVMMNRYPFAAGHLLVVPHTHTSALHELSLAEHDALFRLVREAATRLQRAVKAEGLNVGLNLGAVAGAGVAAHLHVHIVPRWAGDTNFMPVLADTRVIPQALEATRDHLAGFFQDLPSDDGSLGS
ncbi:HIT family protein [Chondromyces apiculatus]|uniref:Histidine triad (HIT) protein n=1 Tax=Chondromyces apiculatus DSM 436 TaxID=1192034 RepID=A0A017T0A8_9BACT|nr:HIT domain-containing protein [Chondromyces apiculatus]EYF01981.1 Histidine triad (HIT) protein [Chondromyces apiculatus DSM 436]